MSQIEVYRIAVIGAGSWGTTLGNLLARKGHEVHLWVREEEVLKEIQREKRNSPFMPGSDLDPRLNPVGTFEEAIKGKQIVVVVVPSHVFRDVLKGMEPHLDPGMMLVAATKGIENYSCMIMSEVAVDVLGGRHMDRFACLAGPSFAREVIRDLPTAVTIACPDPAVGRRLQRVFSTEAFRVYATGDLVGVQLAGALKNVIAIGAGASDGLGFGSNARAALITRAIAEITRLGVAKGANPRTFAGLAGIGDLVLTCTGELSRNRSVGLEIAEGKRLEDIEGSTAMVAEGIRTARSAHELSKRMHVEMPIAEQVYRILHEGKDPGQAVTDLMGRELKAEED